MKQTTCLIFSIVLMCQYLISAQGFTQLGSPLIDDEGLRMIHISDGGFITVGSTDGKLVMYKTDCLGNKVAALEKSVSPGPAALWDVLQMPDGNLLAVGGGNGAAASDTVGHVFLLKTSPDLVEISSSSFLIDQKAAQGKSLALSNSGEIIVWGEVEGQGGEGSDVFFQKVDPATLLPNATAVLFNQGVDLASRIVKDTDGQFLLSGSSFSGNIFDPNAMIDNALRLYKVTENGVVTWQAEIEQTFLGKYGLATVSGVQKSTGSGNYMLAGTLFSGDNLRQQDAFFALIGPDGTVLDTAYAAADGFQQYYSLIAHQDNPGLFTCVGKGVDLQPEAGTIAFAQAYELNNLIFIAAASVDPTNPVVLREVLEIDPGRFAYMGTIPDNPFSFGLSDIVIATPGVAVGVVYQNCALAATLNTTAVAYQWYYEGQPIPNANQGVYFPTQPGLYAIQVLDTKGCTGISDTFRVEKALALFDFTATDLTVEFDNLSNNATQYQWNFGDGGTSVSINPTHTYATGGVYEVTLIAKTACGAAFADTITQQVVVMSSASEEPGLSEQTRIFPNPTFGKLTIATAFSAAEPAELLLSNAIGQVVFQELVSGVIQLDIRDFPSGVYTLSLRSGNALNTFQVVKQ